MIVFDRIAQPSGQMVARHLQDNDLMLSLNGSVILGKGSHGKRSVALDFATRIQFVLCVVKFNVTKLRIVTIFEPNGAFHRMGWQLVGTATQK